MAFDPSNVDWKLADIIRKHVNFLNNYGDGKRADLRGHQQRGALLRTAPPPATLRQMGGLARWWRAAPRAAAAIAPARRESMRRAARRAARPAGPMRVSRRGCRCRNTYHTRIHTCDTPCVLAAGGGDLGGCMGGDGGVV
mgnify:CR=1 FL=1